MAGKVDVRWPTEEDIQTLIARIRADDLAEMEATIGRGADQVEAMRYVIAHSSHAWAILINNRLAMIGGLYPMCSVLGGDEAQPWMMATDLMDSTPRILMRVALRYLSIMRGHYPRLSNHVDARNRRSIRWLQAIGFTVHPHTVPFGPYGLPFHPFEMNS